MTSIWEPNRRADALVLRNFADCILDIRDAAQTLERKEEIMGDTQHILLKQTVRKVSVAVRKLCLDGGGRLVRRCIDAPALQPVQKVKDGPTLRLDQKRPGFQGRMVRADGREADFEFPEATHQISLSPLPGVEFGQPPPACTIRPPFDGDRSGLRFRQWLKQKVLQIDSVTYTAETLLRLVANYEGAHTSEHLTLVPSGLDVNQVDTGNEMQYRLGNLILFGGLSYAQYFTLYTGLQVMFQARYVTPRILNAESGQALSADREIRPTGDELVIRGPVFSTKVAYAGHPLFVFGDDGRPHAREGSVTTTMISVPSE